MRLELKALAFVAAWTPLISPLTLASPLAYDEAVDGDLPYVSPTVTPILPFDLGNNRIKGTFSYQFVDGSLVFQDLDSFGFTVPTNSVVQRIRLAWGPYDLYFTLSNVLRDRDDGSMIENFALVDNSQGIDNPNPSEPYSAYWSQLMAGHSYSITMAGGQWQYPGGVLPYEWSFLITRAPEPGTLALLSLGLVGLGLSRRREA